jgi:NTE family protein
LRLGLALGGGLPFGVSTIGVLEVFERYGIPVDCIAGTSMGSIVGLLYAYGYSPKELAGHFQQFFARRNLLSIVLHDVRLTRTGFVNGKHLMRTLGKLVPETVCFEDLRLPLMVPAADLLTGQEIVFHKGPVMPAIRASISMPGIFTPVPWGGTYLVDGAVITPIPLHLLPRLGADVGLPVRAIRQMGADRKQRFVDSRDATSAPPGPAPDLLRLMWRSLSLILQDQFSEMLMQQCKIAIRPEIPVDFAASPDKLEEIIDIGRAEAEKHVLAVRKALGLRRPATAAPSRPLVAGVARKAAAATAAGTQARRRRATSRRPGSQPGRLPA